MRPKSCKDDFKHLLLLKLKYNPWTLTRRDYNYIIAQLNKGGTA